MRKRVLVTGGAGYIGSHTCKQLSQSGFDAVTIDNLSLGYAEFVKWGPLVRGDIRDTALVARTLLEYNITSVIHFAASAYVEESVRKPETYYGNNVIGMLSVLDAMRYSRVNNILYSSSCSVYGEPDVPSVCEKLKPSPVSPYGRSKQMCESIAQDYATAHGINCVILRYFNASGDDPDCQIGERREPEPHLIPRALMALQGYVDDFKIFGNDFSTADGTAVRDYIHVVDLAQAHVLALCRLENGDAVAGIYNLGAGRGYSVTQVLDAIASITGQRLLVTTGPRRKGDPACLVADTALARKVLGFEPTHSDLQTIVSTAWNWHQKAHPSKKVT